MVFTDGNLAALEFPNGLEYGESNIACFETREESTYDKIRSYIHPITIFISCLSLLLMLLLYIFIKELRKNQGLQVMITINHSLALLVGNCVLFVTSVPIFKGMPNRLCEASGKFFLLLSLPVLYETKIILIKVID